ncbi:hypothetical protein BJV82DRAFT_589787 [Fennellomyces sp. T-0311]|nr:hypothetical protein BJV82DRAFT_589787 [Fennellomyces sp. T-0311]
MIKALLFPSSQQSYTSLQQQPELHVTPQLTTRVVLRLTAYGMTDQVQSCRESPFDRWQGHPIMRFIHPDQVQSLCGALNEASKTCSPVSLPEIRCCIDNCHPPSCCYDTFVDLTVVDTCGAYMCILYYYPSAVVAITTGRTSILTFARQAVVASLVLVQMAFHYGASYYDYCLVPVKLFLHNLLMLLLRSKKKR